VGEVEEKLAGIWAEVLKVERVGRHDNFFELGGHSLLAISLIEHMRRAGLHAQVRALFVTPTVAALALAVGGESGEVEVPSNRIPAGCGAISPEMLPLVSLTPEEIERVVAAVPGGASNVQDIYPLAPLQEGILFHHLMAREGDPYLLRALYSFESRARLESYFKALQAVIDRHDILRTGVLWEGLSEPVQVVWRRAQLKVEEVILDPAQGDIARQLAERFDPRRYRIEIAEAPLLRIFIAEDRANARWVMLLLTHHLWGDHTTTDAMQQEIQAHLLGQAEQLPAPLPFRNFVAQTRLGVSREEHEAYFRKLLSDVAEPTAPFGLTDVQGDGSGIVEARQQLDPQLARRLRDRARALGVSAASLCHLAYAQVLSRTAGRDDVVFGTVLFGRMQGGVGADRALGMFINTLPVRIQVGEAGVEESVRNAHAQLAQLLRHEHASLALAQRASAVAAPAPLFSALLNYRHSAGAAQAPAAESRKAWEGIRSLAGEERSNYPLVLSVDDLGEGLRLKAQSRSPIDPARVCGYMQRALEELVVALERSPTAPLRSLDILPAPERHQLLQAWTDTATDYPREASIAELFEAQAARTPQAMALEYEGERLTYEELNTRSNRLAHYLKKQGVTRETRVGLCVERSLEMVVATLAILKAGGAYVPLDPEYPGTRLAFMLEDTQAPVLLTQSGLRERLPAYAGKVIELDADWKKIAHESAQDPPAQASAQSLAYVIYTSGSTGRPKGTAVEQGSVVRLVRNTNFIELTPEEIFLQFAPISFDASTLEIWGPLLNGAKLVIAPAGRLSLEELARLIQERGITTLWLTAALFHQMVDSHREALRGVKQLLAGGEALSVAHVRKYLEGIGEHRLINGYGPTENTTFTCCHVMTADSRIGQTVPIGRPISNTRVYILDAHQQPVPVGVVGELYAGGAGLSRGYLNQPELTAEKFVADPFNAGERLYRTGDLVRYTSEGVIEFQGRIDSQVKVRGYRIELGEIETTLSEHPAVKETVVLAREDTPGDKRLVAYVVGKGEAPAASDLKEHLASRLPSYMLPAAFVTLEALPLTENGKVDRKALPAPERTGLEAEYVAPRTPTEEKLARIWAEVLKVERVGVHDNFFELGGHSLLATQVVSRINQKFNLSVPLRVIFEESTLAGIASYIEMLDLSRKVDETSGDQGETERIRI
jgi:amino acid adenylation domain-containing protein